MPLARATPFCFYAAAFWRHRAKTSQQATMKEKSAYVVSSVVIFVALTLVAHFMISLNWLEAVAVSLAAVVANIVVDALRHRSIFARKKDEE